MEEVYRHPPFDPRRLKPTELDPVVGAIDRAFGSNFRPGRVDAQSHNAQHQINNPNAEKLTALTVKLKTLLGGDFDH